MRVVAGIAPTRRAGVSRSRGPAIACLDAGVVASCVHAFARATHNDGAVDELADGSREEHGREEETGDLVRVSR